MRSRSIGGTFCMGVDAPEYLSWASHSILTRKQYTTSVNMPAAIAPFSQCTVPPGAYGCSC